MVFSPKPKRLPAPWTSSIESRPADFLKSLKKSVALSAHIDEEKEYLMQRAPNAIEWITGKRFGSQQGLFAHWGAYRLVKEFFELRCPVCNEGGVPADSWGLSQDVLESEILLRWSVKDEDDACPKCGTTRSEFVDQELMNNHRVLNSICGQRSGKSSTLALIANYIEHVVLTIAHTYPNGLYGYLGIPAGDLLHITCVASTDTQSKETIWAKFRGYRRISPWFQRYVPWIKAQEKLQDTPEGMQRWEYSEADKAIKNQAIGLEIDSLNSNSNGLAGRTRIAALIDEICRMKQTESSQGAQEVYRTMDASCQTVQGAVDQYGLLPWFGMIGSISSPISRDDYGMQLLEVAKGDRKMYASHLATWDFNPWMPKSRFADLLKKDYVGTMRNFGAQPPNAASPLIDRERDFRASAISKDLKPTASFIPFEFTDTTGRSMLGVKLDQAELILKGQPRVIAVDAGANFDAFSVACAHGESDADGNTITVYDWVIRLLTKSREQEVYFESVYRLLEELQNRVVVRVIEFDHWNSKHIVQRIRNELGIFAEEIATTNEHFIQFMRDSYSGYVKLLPELENDKNMAPPYKSPQGAAIYELLRLERDPKNDKIFNPRKGLQRGVNCGYGDTPVALSDGTCRFLKDMKVGDKVLDRTGLVQTVEGAWCSGTPDEIVELSVQGRQSLSFTRHHEWPVWVWPRECTCGCGLPVKQGKCYVSGHHGGRGQGRDTVVILGNSERNKLTKRIPLGYRAHRLLRSDEIRKGDFLMIPRKFDEVSTNTSKRKARLLGYYAAEGWTVIGTRIDFAFAEKERGTWVKDVVELLAEEGLGATIKHMPSQAPGKYDDPDEGGITIWSTNDQGRIDSRPLVNWLTVNAGAGAKNKRLSEDVMRWPLKLKEELIRGMFRGDGCQTWSTKGGVRFSVVFGVASETLRDQVELILAQLGFPCGRKQAIATDKRTGKRYKNFAVKVGAPFSRDLADMIWGDQSKSKLHARKMIDMPRQWVDEEFVYVPVTGVKLKKNSLPVYNLTVSGDHTYLVKNVATHNSDDTARVLVHAHRLVQDQGYTEKQDDVSRRARRKRAEISIAEWSAGQRGTVFNPSFGRSQAPMVPTGGRKW